MSSDKEVKPTNEQIRCVDEFGSRETLRINAYAGAGKTSTLILCAKSRQRHGMYVAFGNAIAADARKKFPPNVTCSTLHSLAFRALVHKYGNRLGGQKLPGKNNGGLIAQTLGLGYQEFGRFVRISPRAWGNLLMETVRRWCISGRPVLSEFDVPLEGVLLDLEPAQQQQIRQLAVADAHRVWEQMVDPNGRLHLGGDGYVKLWALKGPILAGDFIFVDEAQDTNGVTLEVIRNQSAQIVAVGDRYQSIYEWRGAINAMERMPADREARLTTSFRFGPALALFATDLLKLLGETLPVQGNHAIATTFGPIEKPDVTLCRTNATVLEQILIALEKGQRPFVLGGVAQMLSWLTATEILMSGRPVDKPVEFFGFRNWDDVVEASQQGDARELELWVRLIKEHPPEKLRKVLEALPKSEADAEFLLSTAHKAKGREWGKVKLTSDFLRSCEKDIPQAAIAAELRLLYVAATRAVDRLYVPDSLESTLQTIRERQAEKAAA